MAGRTTTLLVALLVLSLGGVAGGATCERVCGYDIFGAYFCVRDCGGGGRSGLSARDLRCRELCHADVRACRVQVRGIYDCPGRGDPSGRACRQSAKRAFRRCRSEATNTCSLWLSRPRGCPRVFLEATGVERLVDPSDPTVEYVLVDVTLRARGVASIGYLEPQSFTLIAAGETQDRYPLSGLAGPEYCPESMSLPKDGTVACRLAYPIPPGISSAVIEFAFFPYQPTAGIAVPALSR